MQLLPQAASVTGTAAGLAELVERPAAGDAWKSGGATAACGNCSRLRIPGGLGEIGTCLWLLIMGVKDKTATATVTK